MITRHMRTHLQPDKLNELQIPLIDELSLTTPKSQSPHPQQLPVPMPRRPSSPSPFTAVTPPALFGRSSPAAELCCLFSALPSSTTVSTAAAAVSASPTFSSSASSLSMNRQIADNRNLFAPKPTEGPQFRNLLPMMAAANPVPAFDSSAKNDGRRHKPPQCKPDESTDFVGVCSKFGG